MIQPDDRALPADLNPLGQPIGFALPDWSPPPRPARAPLSGRYCRLEPLQPQIHAAQLYAANGLDVEQRMWTYLPYGPFDSFPQYVLWLEGARGGNDPLFFAVIDGRTKLSVGVVSYLRIEPAGGSIELGHVAFSPKLQRTPAATECLYLMLQHAFTLGYRRAEWKCDALNAPSRRAAERLGFTFEGIFRQATVYKRRNRDTAWYSIIDQEWPLLETAFVRWLAPVNFDVHGQQRTRLSELTSHLRKQSLHTFDPQS